MRKKQRSLVTCGYIQCVADISRDEAFEDVLGTFWCPCHRIRGSLLNYGAKHHFPEVAFSCYAIGGDRELWKIAAALGNVDMLNAATQSLGLLEDAL